MPETALSENIKLLRQRGGYTQKQFATALGISAATLSSYETGKTDPDPTVVCKIAAMFSLTTDQVVGLCDPENEEGIASELAAFFTVKN